MALVSTLDYDNFDYTMQVDAEKEREKEILPQGGSKMSLVETVVAI